MSLRAVAVTACELRDLAVDAYAAREHEADVALLEHVRRAVANAGLGARIGGPREPERVLVEVRGLLGVPDPELEVIPALERHEVLRAHVLILTPVSGLSAPPGRGCSSSSNPRRSGTSRMPDDDDHEEDHADERGGEERRLERSPQGRRATPARAASTVSPSSCTPGGRPWFTITPMKRHAERRPDRARELRQRGRRAHRVDRHRVLHADDERLHHQSLPDAGDHRVERHLARSSWRCPSWRAARARSRARSGRPARSACSARSTRSTGR